jgi:hypothetical protein
MHLIVPKPLEKSVANIIDREARRKAVNAKRRVQLEVAIFLVEWSSAQGE